MATANQPALSGQRTWQWWRFWVKIFPYLAISAFYIRFLIFTLYPFYYSIILSMRRMTSFTQSEYVGFRNFWILFARDTVFLETLLRATVYALASALTHIPAAFILAYIFNDRISRGRNLLRICYLLPLIVSGSVIATLASMAFNQQVGLVNQILGALRLPNNILWLDHARYTMVVLVILAFWRYTGYHMIIYLAGLQAIDPALYEAARIDGASESQVFMHVTIPNMRPAMAFSLITSLIGSFQLFDLTQIIWPSGGPERSAFFPLNYIYQRGLREFRLGEAAAAGWILFLVTVILSIGWYKLLRVGRED